MLKKEDISTALMTANAFAKPAQAMGAKPADLSPESLGAAKSVRDQEGAKEMFQTGFKDLSDKLFEKYGVRIVPIINNIPNKPWEARADITILPVEENVKE